MPKRASLSDAMRKTVSARPQPAKADLSRPGRVNQSNVTGYFPMETKDQLRILAAERRTTIQRLLAEALNDLFAKHNKPEIVPLGD